MSRALKFGRKASVSGKAGSVVIFVHGYGADGADLLGIADVLGPHLPDTVFYAPDAPQACAASGFGRQWFPIPRFDGSSEVESAVAMNQAADDLNGFIDITLQAEAVSASELVLVGFSQGAMMGLHVAPRRADTIAGLVAISGKLMRPNTLAMEMTVKPEALLMHGDRDDVVPFGEMQAAGNTLVANGFKVFAHVMKGGGHGISQDGLGVMLSFIAERLPKAAKP